MGIDDSDHSRDSRFGLCGHIGYGLSFFFSPKIAFNKNDSSLDAVPDGNFPKGDIEYVYNLRILILYRVRSQAVEFGAQKFKW